MFAKLLEQDARLVAAGFPPLSEWWRETFRCFYESGKRFLTVRCGRRGGKSSSLSRFAVNEAINGRHKVPPGDVGYFAFISTKREEATARLVTVRKILDALKVGWRPTDNGCVVHDLNVGFRVYVASIAGVSGFTCIGFLADELAKWQDAETGANPAKEVLASLRPTLATMPRSRGILASSPFSTLDAHAEAFALGDTDAQMVAHAPTWIANPTVSEADTHALEPDDPTWRREYLAEPMGAGSASFFDPDAIDAAATLVGRPAPSPGTIVSAGADFAFVRDHAALAIAHHVGDWQTARVSIVDTLDLAPPLRPREAVSAFAARLKEHGCTSLMADNHYRMSIVEHLDEFGLGFLPAPMTPSEPYVRTRVLLHDRRLQLPKDSQLVKELKRVMSQPTPNGLLRIILPRRGSDDHLDLVSAMVLAVFNRSGTILENQESLEDPVRQAFMERWLGEVADEQRGMDWLQRRYR